ncbi:MAG: hypothetical protein PHV34_07145 [Verrucomicrobiae bacterium]|nr:hypothetical protein [Verrucomicrobiae bacterium]
MIGGFKVLMPQPHFDGTINTGALHLSIPFATISFLSAAFPGITHSKKENPRKNRRIQRDLCLFIKKPFNLLLKSSHPSLWAEKIRLYEMTSPSQ